MFILRNLVSDLQISRTSAPGFVALGLLWAGMAAQVPVLKAQIGASDAAFGLVFLLSSIGSMTAMWAAPRIDKWLGRRSVAMSMSFLALMFLLPGLATGIAGFAAALLLVGMGSGMTDVLMNARVSELEADSGRPLMNLNHAVFSFAYAFSAILTGWAREAGWPPFAVFACFSVLVLALAPRALQTPHDASPDSSGPRGHQASAPVVWIAGLVVMAAFLSESSVEGWSTLHLERTLGGAPAEGAMGPAILGLTMGFGRLFGQLLAARFADWLIMVWACLLASVGLAVAATAQGLPVAYLGFAAMGLGVSVVAPLALALVGRLVHPSVRVAAIGRAALIGFAAFAVGPGLMGLASEAFGLRVAFLIVAGMLGLTALLLVPRLGRVAVSVQ